MARHDQRNTSMNKWSCDMCRLGSCENCIDVLRMMVFDQAICMCKKPNHQGEAVYKQIVDPETETVHAPHATVTSEGEVKIDEQYVREWAKQFDV